MGVTQPVIQRSSSRVPLRAALQSSVRQLLNDPSLRFADFDDSYGHYSALSPSHSVFIMRRNFLSKEYKHPIYIGR